MMDFAFSPLSVDMETQKTKAAEMLGSFKAI